MLIFEYITVQCVLISLIYFSFIGAKEKFSEGDRRVYGFSKSLGIIFGSIMLSVLLIHSIFVRNVSFVKSFIESDLFEKPLFILMLILIVLGGIWVFKIKLDEKNKDNK